jgi:hypothetical protein
MMSFRLPLLALGLAAAFAVQAQVQSQPKPKAGSAPRAAAQQPAAPAAPANAGGISNPEFEKAGQTAAHAWLLLLDRKDWGTAWDTSGAVFRQNVPLGTWMDNVPKLRDPFGAFIERKPAEVVYKKTLAGRPDADYVTAIFVTKFDKKPDAVETVTTMREADGRWRVMGYQAK